VKRAAAALLLVASVARAGSTVTAKSAALATSSPLATRAGLQILQKGGNAADAAVAVAFALGAVQPQSGNLGGGGFLVYYDASTHGVWTLDFRELAPRAATRDMFARDANAARNGARAAAVPGTVAGLEALHAKFGSKPWKELLEPAVLLARDGLRVDTALAERIAAAKRERNLDLFNGAAAGTTVPQPELAATLTRIAEGGARTLYEGDLAKKLVERVQAAGGTIGFRDLRDYQPLWRAPLKLRYGAYDVYTVAPPAAGGLLFAEALNILANDDLRARGYQTPKALHLIAEAERRAAIDRGKYAADPAVARIPYRELLSRERADTWRRSIDELRATATGTLTEPSAIATEREHTTHFTIADARGNVAAVTISLGDDFGSGFLVPGLGFLLNNAMGDFGAAPNDLAAQKRPVASMAPTLVLRDGAPFLALGTSGGPSIPTTILQVFLNVVVYGRTLPDAVAAPRYDQQATPEDLGYERALAPQPTIEALNLMGHGVAARESIGDVQAILFDRNQLIAVADPRHGGAAGGF
jgi:gamma-glutamyltranspeptidase/glutathione hydrolase